jgi:hypothetical protein
VSCSFLGVASWVARLGLVGGVGSVGGWRRAAEEATTCAQVWGRGAAALGAKEREREEICVKNKALFRS